MPSLESPICAQIKNYVSYQGLLNGGVITRFISRKLNTLTFYSLNDPAVVTEFMRSVFKIKNKGFAEIYLDFSEVKGIFPNVCTPIAGLIRHYTLVEEIDFIVIYSTDYFNISSLENPLKPSDSNLDSKSIKNPLDRVWEFSSDDDIKFLVDGYLNRVSENAKCENGVLAGLEWCLNEVMDNVLQHSDSNCGYSFGQIHGSSKHIAICIFDTGKGFYNSLKGTKYKPKNSQEAIKIALREGVTRDPEVGQGNGLWGLHNIVSNNSGLLNIVSGPGFWGMTDQETKIKNDLIYLSPENLCTTVDFQIDFFSPISISKSLGGYKPTNLRLESFEDEFGQLAFYLNKEASNTGTRRSGVAMRNKVYNLLKESGGPIIIDFSEVKVISSSFADELLGKLVYELGVSTFNEKIKFKNINEEIRNIISRSASLRLNKS